MKGEGVKDSRIFTLTLEFMMNIHADKEGEVYARLEADDQRVVNVLTMFKKYFLHLRSQCFDDVCSKTFQFIYKMCHLPNVIAQDMIKELWAKLLEISRSVSDGAGQEPAEHAELTQAQFRASQSTQTLDTLLKLPATLAARFIFMIGYVAMKELIYLDVDVFSNLKYRQVGMSTNWGFR